MKKFSVLFVAMLIALMLFVGCENKPKERAATTDDLELVLKLGSGAIDTADDAFGGKFDPAKIPGISMNKEKTIVTFDEFKITNKSANITVIVCGTFTKTENGFCLDLTKGTKLNGTGHTLYYNYSYEEASVKQEIILDGVRLTDLDKFNK